jgi:Uma2 family endonuclease
VADHVPIEHRHEPQLEGTAMSVDPRPLTLAEFLAWEERQQTKHEFRNGAMFAMAGATDDHGQIVTNPIAIIRPILRGSACRAYANDIKVVTTYPGSRYPDILVTCDARDAADRLIKRHPKLIIEVLSDSTAAVDANEKLDEYQTIGELEEYVLVDSRKLSVRVYRRSGDKLETGPATIAGEAEIHSLGLSIALADIYEDVSFDRLPNRI